MEETGSKEKAVSLLDQEQNQVLKLGVNKVCNETTAKCAFSDSPSTTRVGW